MYKELRSRQIAFAVVKPDFCIKAAEVANVPPFPKTHKPHKSLAFSIDDDFGFAIRDGPILKREGR